MIPYSGLAAFLMGVVLWWSLVARKRSWTVVRGLWVGALVGFLSHPFAWYLAILGNFTSGTTSSLGELPLNPVQGLLGALVFSVWSWLLAGWLTVPVAGIIGLALARTVRNAPVDDRRIG